MRCRFLHVSSRASIVNQVYLVEVSGEDGESYRWFSVVIFAFKYFHTYNKLVGFQIHEFSSVDIHISNIFSRLVTSADTNMLIYKIHKIKP